jgi:hypothetical protein
MLVDSIRYVWPTLLQVLPNGRMAMPAAALPQPHLDPVRKREQALHPAGDFLLLGEGEDGGGAACLWSPALDALDLPVKVGDMFRILPLAMDHVFSFGFQLRLQGAHVALVLEVASRLTSTESTRQDGEFATLGARSLGQAAFAPPGERTHQP